MANQKHAIFPGSFAPFSKGHQEIVTKALHIFDHIYIAVGQNSEKQTYFSQQQRVNWIESVYSKNKKITVIQFEGLTVDQCKDLNTTHIIRGIRDKDDFKFEQRIADHNKDLEPNIETILLLTSKKYSHISSTIIRDIIKNNGDLKPFLPKEIITAISHIN